MYTDFWHELRSIYVQISIIPRIIQYYHEGSGTDNHKRRENWVLIWRVEWILERAERPIISQETIKHLLAFGYIILDASKATEKYRPGNNF